MTLDSFTRLRNLIWRRKLESELTEELQSHLEHETDKLIRNGLPPDDARRQARLAFGFAELVKDDCREARGTRWLEEFTADIAFGLRQLRANRGFAAVAIASLALGIGATTAMFQLVDAIGLRTLPVRDPQQLRIVRIANNAASGNFTSRYSHLSWSQWQGIETRQQAFSSMAAWSPRSFNLAEGGETRPAEGMLVTPEFFHVLGVTALRGRVFHRDDESASCSTPVTVISQNFRDRELAAVQDPIGSFLRIDGHSFRIIGVTPPSFFGVEVGRSFDIAIPLCAENLLAGRDSQITGRPNNYWLAAIGRMHDGWTPAQVDAHMAAISPSIFAASLPSNFSGEAAERYRSMKLETHDAAQGVSWMRVQYERPLWLLLASAALVLLIACANLASLLLARASSRANEFAVRLSLGASAPRIVRQLLTESLMLAVAGAACGLAVAHAASKALVAFLVTSDDPVSVPTAIDLRVLGFALAVTFLTCLLFGLAPAFRATTFARVSARNVTAGRERSLFRKTLVVAQVALSLVLVAGAILFSTSAWHLLTGDTGFRADQVLVTSIDIRGMKVPPDRQKEVFARVVDRLRTAPGVIAAAQSNIIPISGWESNMTIASDDGKVMRTLISTVTDGYFAALRIPILAGRDFGPQDTPASEKVAIVNQAFADRYLGAGANPVGRTLGHDKWCRIVGVVPNTKYRNLRENWKPVIFFPESQNSGNSPFARFVVRSNVPLADAAQSVQAAVAAVSPAISLEFLGLDRLLAQSVLRERLLAVLGAGFGILAALLAAVGLYGLLACAVESRKREIGVRLAVGAGRSTIIRLVLREAGLLVVAGVILGTGAAVYASRAVATLLYGLKPNDPIALGAAALMLLIIGLIASGVPARRAATLDPLIALRQE